MESGHRAVSEEKVGFAPDCDLQATIPGVMSRRRRWVGGVEKSMLVARRMTRRKGDPRVRQGAVDPCRYSGLKQHSVARVVALPPSTQSVETRLSALPSVSRWTRSRRSGKAITAETSAIAGTGSFRFGPATSHGHYLAGALDGSGFVPFWRQGELERGAPRFIRGGP